MWVLALLLGLAAGLLVNVLSDNLPPDDHAPPGAHRPALRAPHCRACGLARPAEHWLALFHWRGRCRFCAAARPARAALTEAGLALGFVYLWFWAGGDPGRFLAAAVVTTIFALITVIDLEHRLILWRTVWVSAIGLALLGGLSPERGWAKTLVGGLAGYGLVFGLFLLGQLYAVLLARLRGQPLDEIAFGGGDVNLAGLIGLAVGWSGVLFALFIGVVLAGLFSLGYLAVMLARRRYNPHTPFAYGPFLVVGGLLMYLHGQDLVAWWFRGR